MEDRDASEFSLVLSGYYTLLTGKELPVDREREIYVEDCSPPYLSLHSVIPSNWSYMQSAHLRGHCMAFSMTPPYHAIHNKLDADRNMNTTLSNMNHKIQDEFGFDIHSVLSMEILEGTKTNGLIEAKNEEVLRRVAEMQKMVENSERYLNEQGELMDEYERHSIRHPWSQPSIELDSDCDSMASSKVSSNEETPAPGVLKHSDSLVLLAESINHDLSDITKGLTEPIAKSVSQQSTPKLQRRNQGFSQILTDLQNLSNDLSQSESDSESCYTPNSSPIRRNPSVDSKNKIFRSSFGLHSPDSSDPKEYNLKEYLRQLREASNSEDVPDDLAAEKLKELYGFELTEEILIEPDADLIDLRSIPPPQTPDELDALSVLDAPPTDFADEKITTNLEDFLTKNTMAPPAQKITPAKELTPEEIMSFIIPPPPGLGDDDIKCYPTEPIVPKVNKTIPNGIPKFEKCFPTKQESLYSNGGITESPTKKLSSQQNHVIEYPTIERKSAFSCCSKTKKEENLLELPPKLNNKELQPPERPPKSQELHNKISTLPRNGRQQVSLHNFCNCFFYA